MSKSVSWVIQLSLNKGKADDFKKLMHEMVASTKNEAGAQGYEWFQSEDGKSFHIYERYQDSAAVLAHLGNFGAHFMGRFLECVTPTGLTVYGEPNADARGALAGFGAVHYGTYGGFFR